MARRVLEWQIVVMLLIGIVFGGKLLAARLANDWGPPQQIGTNSSGRLTAVMNIVVAEQHQTFARFVDTKAEGVMKIISLGFGKAKLYFQWEAKNSYGIKINEKQPVEWRRTDAPGEILVTVPAIELLESKIFLEPSKYVMFDVDKSIWVDEESRKSRYRAEQVRQTEEAARVLLADSQLIQIAKTVVGDHIKNILNQGLTTDKIHSATVEFRAAKPADGG